jgi:HSP20 family protein
MKINKTPQKRSLEGEHIMNEVTFFDSLFNDLIGNCAAPAGSIYYTANTPKVDVKEENQSYTIEMELPGRTENDVTIELNHDNLIIASNQEDKKQAKEEKKNETKYLLRERKYGNFKRSFCLPSDVDSDSINASFKNGVLTVTMAKKLAAMPKKIAIEAAS